MVLCALPRFLQLAFSCCLIQQPHFIAIAQRMNEWTRCLSSKIGADKLKKVTTIGNARWWSKAGAIQKIFGNCDDGEAVNNSLYVYMFWFRG
jgi:hypothetical protein